MITQKRRIDCYNASLTRGTHITPRFRRISPLTVPNSTGAMYMGVNPPRKTHRVALIYDYVNLQGKPRRIDRIGDLRTMRDVGARIELKIRATNKCKNPIGSTAQIEARSLTKTEKSRRSAAKENATKAQSFAKTMSRKAHEIAKFENSQSQGESQHIHQRGAFRTKRNIRARRKKLRAWNKMRKSDRKFRANGNGRPGVGANWYTE